MECVEAGPSLGLDVPTPFGQQRRERGVNCCRRGGKVEISHAAPLGVCTGMDEEISSVRDDYMQVEGLARKDKEDGLHRDREEG